VSSITSLMPTYSLDGIDNRLRDGNVNWGQNC
jgi:hypothetical protein